MKISLFAILIFFFIMNERTLAQSEIIVGYNGIKTGFNDLDLNNFRTKYYLGYFHKIHENNRLHLGGQILFGRNDYFDFDVNTNKYILENVSRSAILSSLLFRISLTNPDKRVSLNYSLGIMHFYVPQTIFGNTILKKDRIYAHLLGIGNQLSLKINVTDRFNLTTSYFLSYFPSQTNLKPYGVFHFQSVPLIGVGIKFNK